MNIDPLEPGDNISDEGRSIGNHPYAEYDDSIRLQPDELYTLDTQPKIKHEEEMP